MQRSKHGKESIDQRSTTSRRRVLKGAVAGTLVGAAGLAGGAFVPTLQSFAAATKTVPLTPMHEILDIARTAERLAVTFYHQALMHADALGMKDEIAYIRAALVEEQIHEFFFRDNGGQSSRSEFSFPHGAATFTHLPYFLEAQQQLEELFLSAYLAAVREFALHGQSRLAQIVAQIATIESEHRVLGRVMANKVPANNWAFTPVLLASVADVPGFLMKSGYFHPIDGNRYVYAPVGMSYSGVTHRQPDVVGS